MTLKYLLNTSNNLDHKAERPTCALEQKINKFLGVGLTLSSLYTNFAAVMPDPC